MSGLDVKEAVLEYLQKNHNVPFNKCVEEVGTLNSLDKGIVRTAIVELIKQGKVTQRRHAGLNLASPHVEQVQTFLPRTASAKKLSEMAQKLFDNIPKEGFVGNVFLRSKLGISNEEYWRTRSELLAANLIQTGKGRGGSVARTQETVSETIAPVLSKALSKKESDLYKPLQNWLNDNWGRDSKEPGDFFEVRVTAPPSGHKRKSGKWSRPDLVSVEVHRFDYLPSYAIDVTTFEVKQYKDAENPTSVYEAAAHARWANYAYLVIEVPNPKDPVAERITSELSRFKVGLLTIYQKNGNYECAEMLEPIRQNPELKQLDSLLKDFFRDQNSEKLYKSAIGR